MTPVITEANGQRRPKYYIEEVNCAIHFAFSNVESPFPQGQKQEAYDFQFGLTLDIVRAGFVTVDGQRVIDYSVLRKKIQSKIAQVVSKIDGTGCSGDLLSSYDLAQVLLNILSGGSPALDAAPASGADGASPAETAAVGKKDSTFDSSGPLSAFMNADNDASSTPAPVLTHNACRSLYEALATSCETMNPSVTEFAVTTKIHGALENTARFRESLCQPPCASCSGWLQHRRSCTVRRRTCWSISCS